MIKLWRNKSHWLHILVCWMFLGVMVVQAQGLDDTPLKQVLSDYVDGNGLVDYAGLKAHPQRLKAFVLALAQNGPTARPQNFVSRSDSLAFWINAYNALVLYGVTEAYPITSVTQIGPNFGFFKEIQFSVDGRNLTLDHIENSIIRPTFKDPRIHAAINCAAQSCPRLLQVPFVPGELESQLDKAMAQMIRSPMHVQFDFESKTLHLSQIFNWFQSDFVGLAGKATNTEESALVAYVVGYLPEADRRKIRAIENWKIAFNEYDWSLNELASSILKTH